MCYDASEWRIRAIKQLEIVIGRVLRFKLTSTVGASRAETDAMTRSEIVRPATIDIIGGTDAASPEQLVPARGSTDGEFGFPTRWQYDTRLSESHLRKNDILSYRYGQKNQSESRLEPLLGNVPSLDWNRRQAVFQNETPL